MVARHTGRQSRRPTTYCLRILRGDGDESFAEEGPVRRLERLLAKVEKQQAANNREPIKTWARDCTIVPEFIGVTFLVHNGKKFMKVYVTEDMVGHKLGEFAPTRTFKGHSGGKAQASGGRGGSRPADRKRKGRRWNIKASHRFADMSARKIRPFADLIRGQTRRRGAASLLRFLPNRSARLLEAGAQERHGQRRGPRAPATSTTWSSAKSRVDGGPMLKRIMPRARGTAFLIKRRLRHIHVTLAEDVIEETTRPRRQSGTTGRAAPKWPARLDNRDDLESAT